MQEDGSQARNLKWLLVRSVAGVVARRIVQLARRRCAVMSNPHAAQLERAKRVVNSVMKTRGARFLFNEPVDPVELNVLDYFDIISDPIDLGTIHKRLLDGQRHAWDVKSYYETPLEVFEDVSRVWSNCYTYNKGPRDAPIREICRKTQLHFETKWKEAGLPMEIPQMQASNEMDVPELYSMRKESMELPVRLLDAFYIVSEENTDVYVPLDDLTADNIAHVHAFGKLVPHEMDGQSNDMPSVSAFPVRLCSLVDWCFQYGNLPGIWLVSQHAWYKLLNPVDAYVPFLSSTLHSFMTNMYLINFQGGDTPPELRQSAESSFGSGMGMDVDSLPDEIVDILMEDETVKQGTLALMRKRSKSPSDTPAEENGESVASEFVTSVFSQDSAQSSQLEEEDPSSKTITAAPQRTLRSAKASSQSSQQSSGKKVNQQQAQPRVTIKINTRERTIGRKKPRTHSPSPAVNEVSASLSEVDEDDPLFDPSCDAFTKDDEDEDYIQEGGRRHRPKKVGESETQRLRREKKAMEQQKRESEADRKRGQPPAMTSDFRLPQELVGSALSCWDFLMTFHTKLELPPFPFWRFEAAMCPLHFGLKRSEIKSHLTKEPKQCIQDVDARASALLLQDIHMALCHVLQGKTQFNKDGPTHASLETKTGNNVPWMQSMSLLLLKSPPEDVDDETRSIATFLRGHEYIDLTVHAKLKVLHTLINMVVSTDVFREHLNGLVDKLSVQKAHPYEEKPLNTAVLESMSLSFERRAMNLSADKWMDWFLAHRVGVLSTIGQDYRGVHYWVLGGVSGCYRLYVEHRSVGEQNSDVARRGSRAKGRSKNDVGVCWGWYEGESIANFINWLQLGDLESEKPLLETLNHIPKPIQLERQRCYGESSTLNIISLGYHKMDRTMLETYRMDGYSEVRFPLLRGEGEITEAPGDVHPSTRITACLRALLAAIPFWQKDHLILRGICRVIDEATSPVEAAALSQSICKLQNLICEEATVREEWKLLKKQWESSVRGCPSLHAIMAHLAVFQSFVLSPAHSVHRPAFNVMVQDAKCPLYFPMPGESVVVLKTGCLAHLERYLDVSRQTLAASTAADAFRHSIHPEIVARVQKEAENLTPVQYFCVRCIAYRSPYLDAPPEGTQLADDKALPVQACMWLLLAPSDDLPSTSHTIALPIHVDNALPDFIVKVAAFEQSKKTNWKAGDRFKMFFGGKSATRGSSGIYYKGTISNVKQQIPGEAYDPWESLTVQWDDDKTGAAMKVSPWEIEVDPEEQRKLEEARVRQMESRARQARALAKQHRSEYLADMMDGEEAQSVGDPDYDPLVEFEGGTKSSGRSRRRGSALQELVYYDPKNPIGPVPPEMMALLPGPREFPILIHNFMQRLKGKFKCPVFSGKDLDLYKVFHEVQQRGGYEVVTNVKLWKDVCRTLNVNLKGQTSASYNMRLNYEKCLLDFEHYLSSGRYRKELEEGTAPSCTVFEPFPQKLRGLELEAALAKGAAAAAAEPNASTDQMVTRGARRNRASLSMTQLLMGDASGPDWRPGAAPRSSLTETHHLDSERTVCPMQIRRPEGGQIGGIHMPSVMQGMRGEFDGIRKIQSSYGDPVEIQPGESIGLALDRMGWALMGSTLWRCKTSFGKWYKVEVTDFNRQKNEYCLVADKGTKMENVEWVDIRELEGGELSQKDPLPGDQGTCSGDPYPHKAPFKAPPPSERSELTHLLAPPRALQRLKAEGSTEGVTPLMAATQPGMDPMDLFHQVLGSGMDPERRKQIVDDDALKRICEEASRDRFMSLSRQSSLTQTPVMGHLASLLTEGLLQGDTRTDNERRTRTPGSLRLDVPPSLKPDFDERSRGGSRGEGPKQ